MLRCGAVLSLSVIPAKAGIHFSTVRVVAKWIPACAGMTDWTQQARENCHYSVLDFANSVRGRDAIQQKQAEQEDTERWKAG